MNKKQIDDFIQHIEEAKKRKEELNEAIEANKRLLGKLVEKVFDLKYNGTMVYLSKDNYIPESVWEQRFTEHKHIDDIVFRALNTAIEEDEILKNNQEHGFFLCKHEDDVTHSNGWLLCYQLKLDGIDYVISIILKWYVRNIYVIEYEILPFVEPLGLYGLPYVLDLQYKINWSKIHLPLETYHGYKSISYLATNEITDVPKIVKQFEEKKSVK